MVVALGFILAIGGCSPPPGKPVSAPTPERQFTRYHTPTATSTPTPPDPATPTPLPSPTPTPRTHIVKAGEDMGGIAYRYRVSVPALQDANPGVDPHAMSIGTVLVLPPETERPPDEIPLPTPVTLTLSPVMCHPTKEGGAWCFLLAVNANPAAVESITAVVRLADKDAQQVNSQLAVAALDLLPAGGSLPLAAYFPPPLPSPFQVSAELLTALPLTDASNRYLPTELRDIEVQIAEDGLSAGVRGKMVVTDGQASRVRALAFALDADGKLVGIRRWERVDAAGADEAIEFSLTLYSAGGKIGKVEVLAEARP